MNVGGRVFVVNVPFEEGSRHNSGDADLWRRRVEEEARAALRSTLIANVLKQPYGTLLCAHRAAVLFSGASMRASCDAHVVAWPGRCARESDSQADSALYMSPYPCHTCGWRAAIDWDVSCVNCLANLPRYRMRPFGVLERRLEGAPARTAGAGRLGGAPRWPR